MSAAAKIYPTRSQVTTAELHGRSYRAFAERVAVLNGAKSLTYAQLGERVHRLSNALLDHGMGHGDRGVILIDNDPSYFVIDQALFVGGFIRVAVSTRLHVREVVHILADCAATTVFVSPEWAQKLAKEREGLPELKLVVTLHGGPGELELSQLIESGSAEPPTFTPLPDDPAAILYTSGTTGDPKGATLSHANWLAMVRNCMIELPPVTSDDVVLHTAPLSHLSGYVSPPYFVKGGAHLALSKFDPAVVLDLVNQHKVTVLPMVPTILNLVVQEAERRGESYPSLRNVVYAGSAISPDRLARATAVFGNVFTQFYGLSELPIPLACLTREDHSFAPGGEVPPRLASAGRVSSFVEARILGLNGEVLPPDQVGEISVRGDSTMMGYWGRPEDTAEMLDDEGWARTAGSRGPSTARGTCPSSTARRTWWSVAGTTSIPPKSRRRSRRTTPCRRLRSSRFRTETWGESLMAFVVVRDGHAVTTEDVLVACAQRLASYKKPRTVEFVRDLPQDWLRKAEEARAARQVLGGRRAAGRR